MQNQPEKFFKTPFTFEYWKYAFGELKKPKTLIIAALLIAVRVALKSIKIPIAESLFIYVTFIPNALLSMICGPVVGAMSGAISDILGVVLFPSGAFYPPFILVEVMGSFIFALFLYRTRISVLKIFLSKFSVSLVCNIFLTPLFLSWMNSGKSMFAFMITRIPKNLIYLPIETIVLAIVFIQLLPIMKRMNVCEVCDTNVRAI